MKITLFLSFVCCIALQGTAQLQLDQIMKGPGFVGALPESPEWSLDGKQIYYLKKHPDSLKPDYYSYNVQSAQTKVLSAQEWQSRWVWTSGQGPLNQVRIFENQLQYNDIATKQVRSFTLFTDDIWNLQAQNKLQTVVFQQGQSLFVFDLQHGLAKNIVTYKKAKAAKPATEGLSQTELDYFESMRKQALQSTEVELPQVKFTSFEPQGTLQIDPSAHFVLLKQEQEPEVKPTEVPHYIAADAHVFNEKSRGKVQNEEPSQRLFLHDLRSDSLVELDFSGLTQLNTEDRDLIFHPVIFAKTKALALLDVRSADNKDRWIVCIDLATQQIQELEHQHDSAWIGGPGISSWNFETGTLGWLKDANVIYFQSEQSGYSHLYTLDLQTKTKMALTSGNYEVHEVRLSQDSSSFWLSTNMQHPGTRNFYKLDLKTSQLKPLLSERGAYEVQLSPDEKQLAYRFSTSTQPWELFTCSVKDLKAPKQITHSTTEAFRGYNWHKPEILSFNGSDGVAVYARLYTPKPELKNDAAVLFVHGAGYLQNAHHYWSYYQREFMFHQLLIERGYTVLDVDYRASEGYGRNYRTAIYRHMGGRDLQDFVDAKQFLVANYGIDSSSVGIYGGSYGGFITLMGLFTEPGTFACGAALRSVTDWAHYNHEYTTNILNTPAADPDAYRQSSPIHFAEGLQDPLLILHGMIDDNVQFQDVVRLNQRLIELGKKDWWMALYPVERHSFQYTSSWTDEYRRILELFDTYLLK
jgi:dipeptidyl aminopeptidase/acylaminoacyl peptidase